MSWLDEYYARKKLKSLFKKCLYLTFLTWSIYLEPQKLLNFGLQPCPINRKMCRRSQIVVPIILGYVSTHNSHFLGKSLLPYPETNNNFARRHEVSPLNHYYCKNILVGVESLQKYGQYDRIRNKCMYQIQKVVQCSLLLIFTRFLWIHPLSPNQSLKHVFYVLVQMQKISEVKSLK